ncbi:hypothetical protein BASA83_004421 [Batrachochytrium salamandrivorans]|nr:hypothetical protein BASA83_004421 [Batrachochytrium salamandrivorans]
MDSKLAADLQIPLLELSTPITLRLADGDSSSSLTHRTVPLQLHIGKHVETATFYVTDLVTVSFSGIRGWSATIHVSIGCDPFVESSPVSDVSVPPDILSSFSSLFSKIRLKLFHHRIETLTVRSIVKPGSEAFSIGKIYQLTREEDKVMQTGSRTNLRKRIHSEQQFSHMAHHASL